MRMLLIGFEIVAKCRAQSERHYLHYEPEVQLDAADVNIFRRTPHGCARSHYRAGNFFWKNFYSFSVKAPFNMGMTLQKAISRLSVK